MSLFMPELDHRFVAPRAGMLGGSGRAILVFPVDEAAR